MVTAHLLLLSTSSCCCTMNNQALNPKLHLHCTVAVNLL
jgi:hypothetical protein